MNKVNYKDYPIDPQEFNDTMLKLRGFFMQKGFVETFPQPKLTILAACEDPSTVKTFEFGGEIYPLTQTNQMNLEEELMLNKNIDGLFCLTASYRDEPNPIPDRHKLSFPMFEAEHKGNFDHLIKTISECCVHLDLVDNVDDIPIFTYDELCKHYDTDELTSDDEIKMWEEYGNVVAITYFPERTSPFFNMKDDGVNEYGEKISRKVDFIVCGQETFGCAERESDVDIMRKNFHTISDGEYSGLLYEKFGKERVIEELEQFLNLPMIERWGFGMGITRLVRSLKIVKEQKKEVKSAHEVFFSQEHV